ncbi:MAG: Membrane alanyl aminopeptidase [Crocinitomicaceae bacterium]|jgi:aminopeptidase N|nr:Membrane alanyl aminopeptidase [Crocinitomicaceae bacterium]
MQNPFVYILPAVLAFAVSCGTTKEKKEDSPVVESEIVWDEMQSFIDTNEIELSVPKVFHASETVFTDLVHTKLEVSFDWNKAWLYGKETLTAKPHFYATDSLVLDAKGMEIKSVKLNGADLRYSYDSSFLRIKLNKVYNRTETYTVVIDYIAKPDERTTGGSAAITSDKGLYFINPRGEDPNVMPQIWTQGETEASSVWFPTIDAPNVKTTQEILITVDKKYATLSNGKLIKSTENANGTRTDHWKQELPHAPYLFMMGVGGFKVVKDSYTRPDGTKMEVNYYVEPEWEQYGKAIFGETPAMIKFFSELTGVEYPWDKYSQIVVRDYVSGAMENTGAVIFGEFVYKTDRDLQDENDNSTIAHELFHHWFGDLVTAESWSNLPLNESFANYSQYLWDEHRHGLDEADYNAETEKAGYYQSAENGGSHNLIWYDYDDKEQMFDGHSYNKGGRILHMLRNHLGDEAFFAGLKLYLRTNQFKAAEFHHLRQAFEEVSGQDLTWFFSQWFEASGHPEIEVAYDQHTSPRSVDMRVYQNQSLSKTPMYRIPVQVMVYDDGGEHLHTVVIDGTENKFNFPVEGQLKNVIFDYQQCVLGIIKEEKPQEQFIHQYYNGKRYMARKNALTYAGEGTSDASQQMLLDALSDPFWEIRLTAIEKADKLKDDKANQAMNKIRALAKNDPNSQVRGEALSFLSKRMSMVDYEDLCLDRLKNDRSYYVVGIALNEISKKNPAMALSEAKKLEKEQSTKIKSTIAQIYAGSGDASHLPFFEDLLVNQKLGGYEAIICLNSFSYYMGRQTVDVQEKALPIYKKHYASGGMYTKMFMPQNVDYLAKMIDEKVYENKDKIEAFEKNKDMVEANKLRQEVKRQEELSKNLKAYLKEIEVETGK